MNDPNGVIQWGTQTHLFYQYNPESASFGRMHWGHAVSDDLIHWRDLPIALTPTPGGADERGCWSGCAVNNDGVPTIVYTGVRGEGYEYQTQCLATSRDQLLTWEKYEGNPVLSEIPAQSNGSPDFRDPFVWREGDHWYMVLASSIKDAGGVVYLYRSRDLVRWEFLHPLLVGDRSKNGEVWECPSFFPLGDEWVLIMAGKGRDIPMTTYYFVGSYQNQHFTPEREGILDYGYFYAPFAMRADSNRRLLWGWLLEGRSIEAHLAAGWAGTHAIPRELSLRDGKLHMVPIQELETLRRDRLLLSDVRLSGDSYNVDIEGLALDIDAEITVAGKVGLAVCCSPDGSEQTHIIYDPDTRILSINRENSGRSEEHETFAHEAPHELESGENLRLRILLDGSVLEVIANERTSICSRIYPSRTDSHKVKLFGHGMLRKMSIWRMASIWSD